MPSRGGSVSQTSYLVDFLTSFSLDLEYDECVVYPLSLSFIARECQRGALMFTSVPRTKSRENGDHDDVFPPERCGKKKN